MCDILDSRSHEQRPPSMPAAPFRRAVKRFVSERTSASITMKQSFRGFVPLKVHDGSLAPWVWLAPRGWWESGRRRYS